MLAYVAALTWWVTLMGLPKQVFPAFAWIWLATIAWNLQAPLRAHLDFLRDWSIPLAVLTVYLYSRGLADDLGFATVHVSEPIEVDRSLFGGTLPTEYLQAKLCGVPCERTASPHWYDVMLTTVYFSHFVVALTIAAVLWLRDRRAWVRYMRRYLALNVLALAVYITYPMAPPWLAAQDGLISGNIARVTGRGWFDLREHNFHQKLSAVGNPVAAMPSLHAGIALFVAWYGITRLRRRWRWLLLLYPLAMSFTLVYDAEHYVIDILAGFAVVALALWGCAVWERRHLPEPARRDISRAAATLTAAQGRVSRLPRTRRRQRSVHVGMSQTARDRNEGRQYGRAVSGVARQQVEGLLARENEEFVARRPRSTALLGRARSTMPRGVPMSWMEDLYEHPPVWVANGSGAHFWDVDGHRYLDFYIADLSAFCGHAPEPVVQAVADRMRAGNQFLLPSEDAILVSEHLSGRYGMPKWQFTLSATQANTEVIRIARQATGRDVVLVFDGKYHGHVEDTLTVLQDGTVQPEYHGLPSGATARSRIVAFNDVAALEKALAPRDVAVVLAEPAMTNAGFLPPRPGFHAALRHLTADTGTLLAIDETHTLVTAYAGLGRTWALQPDFLTVGKSIAAGVPLAAYGMTDDIARWVDAPDEPYVVSGVATGEMATGGTLFANALSMAAGRAALTEVLTEDAFARTAALGERLADGLRDAIGRHGLPWSVTQEGSHAYYTYSPTPPHDGATSRAADDPDLRALMRVFMANRGVWESGWWLGPTVSVAHTEADVDAYLEVFADFLTAVTA